MIQENLAGIRAKIEASCKRSGRQANQVKIAAVTKTVPIERISEAARLGLDVMGENKVQEAGAKIPALRPQFPQLKWHMIGHLQGNKAARACELFDCIQSLDSKKLAASLDRRAAELGKTQDCLIEVKVSPEESKSGIAAEEAPALFEFCKTLKNVRVSGLMCIAPYFEDANLARPYFSKARRLYDQFFSSGSLNDAGAPVLSMGMSHDFEAAIEEGSTMIRIGTALFGERTAARKVL